MISKERILEEFLALASIDAPSYGEREITDRLAEKLRSIGFSVEEDNAGEVIGGTAGNLYAFLQGELPGDPICFVGHTDTVEPSRGKMPSVDDNGVITSRSETVLGGDDLCGVVEILEGVRHLVEARIPHRSVEVILMAAEEVYGKGAKAWDYSRPQAKEIYVLDMSGDVGSAAVQAPSLISFEARVQGLASHAGFAPEAGIHAIHLASQAVSSLKLGHLDAGTTLNIGSISGGKGTNIVPELCVVTGEVRSNDHEKARQTIATVRQAFEEVCAAYRRTHQTQDPDLPRIDFAADEHLVTYHVPEDHPVVQRFLRACERLGLPGETNETFGGSDNNILMLHGMTGIVLSCGMERVHSTEEYTTVRELVKGAELVAELLKDAE